MITKIGFQNIRIFEHLTEFELKPLTILTGANNSGKSAMQKMLLLLLNGFEKYDGIQLDKLSFKKELINKTGDFKSNVNYNNPNNQIHFTFQFEDELFNVLHAELVFEGNESGITANLIEIAICDFEDKLFALKKVKPNPNEDLTLNEWIWKWDKELLTNYFEKLYEVLLKFRKEGDRDRILNNISIKLDKSMESEPLTPLENQIYLEYKERGIIAFDSRAIEIQEDRRKHTEEWDNRPNHKIFNENTNDIWKPNTLNKDIFEKFPSKIAGSDFLIYTALLSDIGNDFNNFLSRTDVKSAELRKEFINLGITDSEEFYKEYKKFEMICLQKSYEYNYSEIEDYDKWGTPYSYSINEILSKKNNYRLNYNSFYDVNPILSILQKFYPYIPEPTTISLDVLEQIPGIEPSIKSTTSSTKIQETETEEKQGFYNKCIDNITDYYTNPFKNFLNDFDEMLNRTIIFSANTKIKRQYLYGDYDVLDSPFLEFGVNRSNPKIEFINKWLKELEIAEELKVSKIKLENEIQGQYLGFYYSLIINKQEVPLYDCGSGIHQLVLLLVNIVNAGPNKTFLLEEPETNMHPMLQSKLADLFVEANNKFKINFIIETHSEYMIRKLQYLTVKKDINTENTVIYYLNSDKFVTSQEAKVKKIVVRKNGNLSDTFGSGFYDETTRLQFDLMKLNREQNN